MMLGDPTWRAEHRHIPQLQLQVRQPMVSGREVLRDGYVILHSEDTWLRVHTDSVEDDPNELVCDLEEWR
jgi:hypothetical protein